MAQIKTRICVISDTHGLAFGPDSEPLEAADVVIHCGDCTNDSKLKEYQDAITLLQKLDAPLKIVIAGNHDFTLDDSVYKQKLGEACRLANKDLSALFAAEYGHYGEAKKLLLQAQEQGILFLGEGTHELELKNGASLKVYASPYTPASETSTGWGFQYTGAHDFTIEKGTDIAITHGPPRGIMDTTYQKKRIGCSQLFAAIALSQPRVHCFGHVHDGWGAKLVSWRPKVSERPSHFSDIDNEKSFVVESLATLRGSKFETPEDMDIRKTKQERYKLQRYCHANPDRSIGSGETMFINASLMAEGELRQLLWIVDLDLKPYESTAKE